MPTDIPIVCDMTEAPDTLQGRLAEYHHLFANCLISRDRTAEGIRFRFPSDDDVEHQVRDLAAREQACCAFFTFTITRTDTEVLWEATVVDDPVAQQILDEFYRLPDTAHEGPTALREAFQEQGLTVVIERDGVRRPATAAELGITEAS